MKYIIVTNTIYRKLELVEKSIRSSLNQKIAPMKVILIDQNEESLKLTNDITSHPLFEIQKSNQKCVSGARNSLKIPEGAEWIIFCDDDGHLAKEYSENFMEYLEQNSEIEVIAGSILREDTLDYYSLRHKKGGSLKKFLNSKNLMGSNFAVKTHVFNELERFDENFGAGSYWGSGEETDFCWKAFFANKQLEFVPNLKVIHVPPFNESLSSGFKKSYRYGVGKGALVSKWLIFKRKNLVILELIEMFIVPIIQVLRGLLTFKPGLIVNNIASFFGRIIGLVKYSFSMK